MRDKRMVRWEGRPCLLSKVCVDAVKKIINNENPTLYELRTLSEHSYSFSKWFVDSDINDLDITKVSASKNYNDYRSLGDSFVELEKIESKMYLLNEQLNKLNKRYYENIKNIQTRSKKYIKDLENRKDKLGSD